MTDLSQLVLDSFTPLVGEEFSIDGSVQVRLTDADALGEAPTPDLRSPFSLIFRGPLEPALDQRMHRVEHPSLGVMGLFLVPLGPEDGEARYEAMFT